MSDYGRAGLDGGATIQDVRRLKDGLAIFGTIILAAVLAWEFWHGLHGLVP
jgi:hypothetical protein